ncbi:MAG: lysophospholipid acyltransferase family protein [Lentisphaerae bacterium]|nr:lysophospholipid acyltransferase family protein [Lentisphaerota bacterium]
MTASPKQVVEYVVLRLVGAVAGCLPYRMAMGLGVGIAFLGFHVFRFRRRQAEQRIRAVLGLEPGDPQITRIAWQSWRNVVLTGMEALRFPNVTLEWALSVSECGEFLETLKRHCATGRGGLIASPHTGSWELAAMTCRLAGIPIFSVAAEQTNPLANAYLNRLRGSSGAETLERGSGTMRHALQKLGEGGMLAILPDVRVMRGGIQVPFLGGEANVGKGMAMFARHANAPIFPCLPVRTGTGTHAVRVFGPVQPDPELSKDEDIARMTRAVLSLFEEQIRRDPGQWFWFNKRWVLDPL